MKKINNKISKIFAPIVLASTTLAFVPTTSCSSMYSAVKHIAPYLHEITYNDYTYDNDEITPSHSQAFGCSSVRNGNFYGRNFDYVFNDTPEFIVRVNANKEKKRHASIGVATHFGLRESKLLKDEYKKQLELIPNITLDGINDAGVICSHNVVSTEAYELKNEGTNPNGERLHMLFIPRYVLDNASSAQEAVELIKQRNIVGNLSGTHYLHIMIADANDTFVVEFFDEDDDGKVDVVARKKTGNEQVMTNYYVNNKDNPKSTDGTYFDNDHKLGVERLAILQNDYASANSFAGMEELMKKVMYSNSYRYVHNIVPYGKTMTDLSKPVGEQTVKGDLTSEWYSESFTQKEINALCDGENKPITNLIPITERYNKLKQDYWIARMMDFRNPSNPTFWQTTHNSTYDMGNKHLRVVVQEQYEIYFDYYL